MPGPLSSSISLARSTTLCHKSQGMLLAKCYIKQVSVNRPMLPPFPPPWVWAHVFIRELFWPPVAHCLLLPPSGQGPPLLVTLLNMCRWNGRGNYQVHESELLTQPACCRLMGASWLQTWEPIGGDRRWLSIDARCIRKPINNNEQLWLSQGGRGYLHKRVVMWHFFFSQVLVWFYNLFFFCSVCLCVCVARRIWFALFSSNNRTKISNCPVLVQQIRLHLLNSLLCEIYQISVDIWNSRSI